MIESAYGGTTIEQWVSVDAQLQCSNVSCHANASLPYNKATAEACTQDAELGNGGLWGGMVSPFVNMSLTGWTWYQGKGFTEHPRPPPDIARVGNAPSSSSDASQTWPAHLRPRTV